MSETETEGETTLGIVSAIFAENYERPAFRYALPQRLREVKATAYADALEAAYTALWVAHTYTAEEIAQQALLSCDSALQRKDNGRRGCNMPGLFRETYVSWFIHAYPLAHKALESKMFAVSPFLSVHGRFSQFMDYALARV